MKILFVYLYGKTPQFPIGMGYLSGVLKANGHETKLACLSAGESWVKLSNSIADWQPDIIGFSSMTTTFEKVKELALLIKKQYKDIFQVCGGVHPTLVPDCLEQAPFDAIHRGEGEYNFLDLIEKRSAGQDFTAIRSFWIKTKGKIIKNSLAPLVQNLDELPIPDYDLYYSQNLTGKVSGRAEFMFSRGCPYECSYCSNLCLKEMYHGQKYVRFPGVEKAIHDLLTIKNKYQISYIVIHDDIFSLNRAWLLNFCEEYKEKIKIPFLCNVRPGTCDKELFERLKQACCDHVAIGLESGNPHIRSQILNRKMTNAKILNTFYSAHKAGIATYSFSMIGIPYETPKAIVDTIKLTARLGEKDIPWNYVFHPYPKTRLADICLKNRWVSPKKLDFAERSESVLNMPTIKKKQIQAYFDNFHILVHIQKLALTKKYLPKFLTRLFTFPRLFFIIRFYYYLHKIKTLDFKTAFKRVCSQFLLLPT